MPASLDSRFNIIEGIIDDAVGPDIDLFGLGSFARIGIRTNVEANDEGIGSTGEHDVRFVDRTDTGVHNHNLDFRVLDIRKGLFKGLDGSLDIGFDNDVQVLHFLPGYG